MTEEIEAPAKQLVIISSGIELSPLLLEFLNAGLKFTIILNTTSDFKLADISPREKDKTDITEEGVWYHHEIVKLANAIVPDDLTKSSLAKIFTKSTDQTRILLTDSERFLVQWVSEQHKANQNFTKFFKALTDYALMSIDIYPLKFPENVITIKTQSTQVPLRYFQITGFIDRDSEQKTDLEELQKLLEQTQEIKDKKKAKRPIEIVNLDVNDEILTDEVKKEIREADAILWLTSDPSSLAILLLYKEFAKILKESKAQTTLVCPTRFSFREQLILQLLDIKPNLSGIAELGSGIIDYFVVKPDEASEIKDLRSEGFNVIMEDISKIKSKKDLSAILKGMGISLNDISIVTEEPDKKRSLEDLVTQLSFTKIDEPPQIKDLVSDISDISKEPEVKKEPDSIISKPTIAVRPVELLDTNIKNYDFENSSLTLTQDMVESLMQELSKESPPPNQQARIVFGQEVLDSIPQNEEKEELPTQFKDQDAFTEAIQNLLKSESLTNNKELVTGIGEAISKNADMAAYAAKKIPAALETHPNKPQLIKIFLEFLKPRPLIFSKELLEWLLIDIDSPDFVTFAQKTSIMVQISKNDPQFVEQLIQQIIDYQITKTKTAEEREHIRSLVGMITARDVNLQRKAIQAYLNQYDELKKTDEIWLGFLKFDASLVALEIIEQKIKKGVQIVQDALSRNLGSFGSIIYNVFHAYQKGDIQRVMDIAGTPSDALLRKKKRVELAEKIKKYGSVPIETLARSEEIDPKELEKLVYEMISENEIRAKIEVVEGRLTIVQLTEKENNDEKEGK